MRTLRAAAIAVVWAVVVAVPRGVATVTAAALEAQVAAVAVNDGSEVLINTRMNKKLIIDILLLILIIGAVVAFVAWNNTRTNTQATNSKGAQTYLALQSSNSSFAQGLTAYNAGSYSQAANDFTQALSNTQNPVDMSLLQVYLATSLEREGQYDQAVSVFKTIASSTANSALIRAYAVQSLGEMFYSFKSPAITTAVFTGDPYQSLLVSNNVSTSYRNLFAYAATIYPLAISEYSVAQWYAGDYLILTEASSSTSVAQARKTSDQNAIQAALTAGDRDLPRLLGNAGSSPGDYLTALFTRANTLASMSLADDTTVNVDSTYQQLLSTYAAYGVPDGYVRISYASFIASESGTSTTNRASDIATVLAPLYQGSLDTHGVGLSAYLTNGENSAATRTLYSSIASNDPRFKTLLISLGWSSSDFK